jgi:hypothetical protein
VTCGGLSLLLNDSQRFGGEEMVVALRKNFRINLEDVACSAAPAAMDFAAMDDRTTKRLCAPGDAADGVAGAAWIDR